MINRKYGGSTRDRFSDDRAIFMMSSLDKAGMLHLDRVQKKIQL
jgi:hypothetical protein